MLWLNGQRSSGAGRGLRNGHQGRDVWSSRAGQPSLRAQTQGQLLSRSPLMAPPMSSYMHKSVGTTQAPLSSGD